MTLIQDQQQREHRKDDDMPLIDELAENEEGTIVHTLGCECTAIALIVDDNPFNLIPLDVLLSDCGI